MITLSHYPWFAFFFKNRKKWIGFVFDLSLRVQWHLSILLLTTATVWAKIDSMSQCYFKCRLTL